MQTEMLETQNPLPYRRQAHGWRSGQAFAKPRLPAPAPAGDGAPRETASLLRAAPSGAPGEFVRNQASKTASSAVTCLNGYLEGLATDHHQRTPMPMKPERTPFQPSAPERLEAGLPPSRWQSFRSLRQTAGRCRRHLDVQRLWFRFEEVLGRLWRPFTLFHLSRVPVQIHATYLIYPVGFFAWDRCIENASRGLLKALVFLLVFSCSLLVHEFAHVFTGRHWGIGSRRVLLIPLGAMAELESAPRGPSEIWIALAGPLASFALAGGFWLALHAMGPSVRYWLSGRYWHQELRLVFGFGCALNLVVAIFNLLPCFPMDGGRALRSGLAVLIARVFPQHAGRAFLIATRISVRYVAWLVALGMMAVTILHTQVWIHLFVFPLLVLCAEAEFLVLRTESNPSGIDDL